MSLERVTRNSLVLIVSEVVRRLISFVVAILIARALAVEDFGRFGLAMALAGIFSVLASFGFNPLLTRKTAADRAAGESQLGNILSLKLIFGLLAGGAMILLAALLRYDGSTFTAVALLAAMLPALAWEEAGIALFDGYQRMAYSATVTLVKAAFLLAAIAAVFWLRLGLVGVLLAYLSISWLTAAFSLAMVRRMSSGASFSPRVSQWWPLLREATPFLLIGMVWMLAFRVDMIMLERMKGVESTGLYRSGYAFFEVLLALPMLATRALYPALSQGMQAGRDQWRHLLSSAVRIYILAALPVVIGCALVGDRFVPLFYGAKYAAGGRVVVLLGGFLWLWFGTMTFGWALTAADRLKVVLCGNVAAMAVNVLANLWLIPRYDFFGAALATVASESILLLFFGWQMQRQLGGLSGRALPWRALPAGLALAAVVWFLREANLAAVVAAGAAVYFAVVWLGGALDKDERDMLARLLRRGDQ